MPIPSPQSKEFVIDRAKTKFEESVYREQISEEEKRIREIRKQIEIRAENRALESDLCWY